MPTQTPLKHSANKLWLRYVNYTIGNSRMKLFITLQNQLELIKMKNKTNMVHCLQKWSATTAANCVLCLSTFLKLPAEHFVAALSNPCMLLTQAPQTARVCYHLCRVNMSCYSFSGAKSSHLC